MLRPSWHWRDVPLCPLAQDVQHMQKALAQMNVQLAYVIADVVGKEPNGVPPYRSPLCAIA